MPKPKPSAVYIAVDPGAKGGIAIRDGSSVVTMPFNNGQIPEKVIALARKSDAPDGVELPYEVEAHADAERFAYIVVERSESHWSRFKVHRADAKKAGEAIRKMFPRRNKLVYVDPGHWQGCLGVVGAKNPKGESYSDYAVSKLGAHPKATEDEKAARCILHWAESTNAWGVGA